METNNRKDFADYKTFWLEFTKTKTYKNLRVEASKSLYLNSIYTELLFLFSSGISGNPEDSLIQHQINVLFFVCNISNEEREKINQILVQSNLDCFYSIPDEEFLNTHTYDNKSNVILGNHRFKSWVINETGNWESPVKYPDDGKIYNWDEEEKKWKSIEN